MCETMLLCCYFLDFITIAVDFTDESDFSIVCLFDVAQCKSLAEVWTLSALLLSTLNVLSHLSQEGCIVLCYAALCSEMK